MFSKRNLVSYLGPAVSSLWSPKLIFFYRQKISFEIVHYFLRQKPGSVQFCIIINALATMFIEQAAITP